LPSHDSWVNESDLNAADLVTDFYASHPTAIRSCLKALETTTECSPCLTPTTSSLHTARSTHVLFPNQNPPSPHHTHLATSTSYSTESNRTISNHTQLVSPSHTTLKNSPPLSTTNRWHSIQTYLAKDSPRLPSSPLERTMELSSSDYTQKLTTYTYSPPLSEGTTSPSDYTGPTGNQNKKKPSSITMELMSQLTAKNRLLAPQSDISATTTPDPHSISNPLQKHTQNQSHQDTRPYT